MSNVGKSYWSKKLQENGFKYVGIDEQIARLLNNNHGVDVSDEASLSEWMGQPWDERYYQRSNEYLRIEELVTRSAIQTAQAATGDFVIDTTGSLVHLSEQTRDLLKKTTRVIYLENDKGIIDIMVENYIKSPKPVYWDGMFESNSSVHQDNLKTSYARLLEKRIGLYNELADCKISFSQHSLSGLSADDFMEYFK
jgi:shikimate kinase